MAWPYRFDRHGNCPRTIPKPNSYSVVECLPPTGLSFFSHTEEFLPKNPSHGRLESNSDWRLEVVGGVGIGFGGLGSFLACWNAQRFMTKSWSVFCEAVPDVKDTLILTMKEWSTIKSNFKVLHTVHYSQSLRKVLFQGLKAVPSRLDWNSDASSAQWNWFKRRKWNSVPLRNFLGIKHWWEALHFTRICMRWSIPAQFGCSIFRANISEIQDEVSSSPQEAAIEGLDAPKMTAWKCWYLDAGVRYNFGEVGNWREYSMCSSLAGQMNRGSQLLLSLSLCSLEPILDHRPKDFLSVWVFKDLRSS